MSTTGRDKPRTAVFLLGFGGPESFEEVRPFILNILRGKNVPPARIEAVVEQYRTIGGRSPFNELTNKQALALSARLAANGLDLPVYQGMLCWHPYIADTLKEMLAAGIERSLVIVLAPHRSQVSFDRYINALKDALSLESEGNNGRGMAIDVLEPFHNHPLFIQAAASRVEDILATLLPSALASVKLIFTAHSLPAAMADAPAYAAQIEESARLVVALLKQRRKTDFDWTVSYQSRSGAPGQIWLEPDVKTAIALCKQEGVKNAIVVPIGFLCDHVEVLYDLDIAAAAAAKEAGVNMLRAGTVGVHEQFIQLLFDLVKARSDALYAKPDRK